MRHPLSSIVFIVILFTGAAIAQDTVNKERHDAGELQPVEQPAFPPLNLGRPLGGKVTVTVRHDASGNVTEVVRIDGPGAYCGNSADPDVLAIRQAAHDAALTAKFQVPVGRPEYLSTARVTFDLPAGNAEAGEPAGKRISGGVLNAKAIHLPSPNYPPAARAVRAEGAVTVQVVVGFDGRIEEAMAVSGHPLLRSSSVSAACEANFAPTLLSGQPVKITGVIVYNFVP